ncbi:MAG: 3-deoxy-D-manno-octulosonic acid transferase, partial [Armatimonadaceae bacterium]
PVNLAYNTVLGLLSPWIWLMLRRRLAAGKEDKARWGERWGHWPAVEAPGKSPRIWVHAVSVGETMAAAAVLRALRSRWPDACLMVTTVTTTGQAVAAARPEPDAARYFPIDFPGAARRAVAAAQPDLLLLMEGEIWPNTLLAAHRVGARIAVVNGRLSDKKLPMWRRVAPLIRGGLNVVDRFAMQSDEDARRMISLGVDPAKVIVAGNTKFDESTAPLGSDDKSVLRAEFGIPDGAPVLVCGSTREGSGGVPDEERLVADAVAAVRRTHPDLRVILAPRHLERVDGIIRDSFPDAGRRSRREAGRPDTILDTFGELARVYALADIAFVGGSLVPWGGQSVFQPLAQGVPVVFGPHMNNQRDIAALALAAGVAREVPDSATLAEAIRENLDASSDQKARWSADALELIARNQGAADRVVRLAEELLGAGKA